MTNEEYFQQVAADNARRVANREAVENELPGLLGEGWSAGVGNYDSAKLAGPDGLGIVVQMNAYGQKGRYSVHGYWTEGDMHQYNYNAKSPEITVAIGRGLGVLAKEIQRRILPVLTLEIADCAERKARDDAKEAERERVLVNLLATGEGTYRLYDVGKFSGKSQHLGTGRVDYDGEVSLELKELSEEQATVILRYIHTISR